MQNACALLEDSKKHLKNAAVQGERVVAQASEALEDIRENARHELYETRTTIRRYPFVAVGIAVAAGSVLGLLLGFTASKMMHRSDGHEERFI